MNNELMAGRVDGLLEDGWMDR